MDSIIFMLKFITNTIAGDIPKLDWDLNFNYYFIKHYSKMYDENPQLAEDFDFYFSALHDESSAFTSRQLITKLKLNYAKLSNEHLLPL